MLALTVVPGEAGSARLQDLPTQDTAGRRGAGTDAAAGAILVRTLEVGVCGTDREICAGEFGVAPQGESELILGHEFIGEVRHDGGGFSAGDLVTATVRRGCGACRACAESSPDACDTGDYLERGITRLHGFARELVLEDPAQLIPVPRELGRLGVLSEPASVSARAIRHALTVGSRQIWEPRRALVLGCGAIGMLAAYMLRLRDLEVWAASTAPAGGSRAALVALAGARHVSSLDTPPAELAHDVGGFDLVIEATGDAQVMLDALGLLRRNGVACLLGLDGSDRSVSIPAGLIGIDTVIQNRVLLGSVNASLEDWHTATDELNSIRRRWPDALGAMVGLRVAPDRFHEALEFDGVKATVRFA